MPKFINKAELCDAFVLKVSLIEKYISKDMPGISYLFLSSYHDYG